MMWRMFLGGLNALLVLVALATLGFAAWLAGTGRVDMARLQAIGRILEVLPEAAKPVAKTADAAETRPSIGEAAAPPGAPPSGVQIALIAQRHQMEVDQSRRLAEEAAALRRQVLNAHAALAKEWKAFEEERDQWQAARAAEAAANAEAQFQRVVTLLETIPARQAKDYLIQLAEDGGLDAAVRYLNAMQPFSAAEVMRSFPSSEQRLAADLLRRMDGSH